MTTPKPYNENLPLPNNYALLVLLFSGVCRHCKKPKDKHAGKQCLFGATSFDPILPSGSSFSYKEFAERCPHGMIDESGKLRLESTAHRECPFCLTSLKPKNP